MFIFTAKLHRGKMLTGAVAAIVVCGVLISGSILAGEGVAASATIGPKGIKDNDDRVAYLEQYGWTIQPDPTVVEELLIPETFDESYTQYLDLQTSQGFDLTPYCGERVKRYTYLVTNHPTGQNDVQISLLICDNTVIGGDVLSPQLDGFIHGLEYPN